MIVEPETFSDNPTVRLVEIDAFVAKVINIAYGVARMRGVSDDEFVTVLHTNLLKTWVQINDEARVEKAQHIAVELYSLMCECEGEVV